MMFKLILSLNLVFVSTVVMSLSQVAQASETPCPISHVEKELDHQKLRFILENALTKNDQAQLKKYAPCDFLIAVPETDVGSYRRATTVLPEIGSLVKGLKFQKSAKNFGSRISVQTASPNTDFEILMEKDDATGWYWAGLGVIDSKTYDKLTKNSYEIDTDEED